MVMVNCTIVEGVVRFKFGNVHRMSHHHVHRVGLLYISSILYNCISPIVSSEISYLRV